MPRPTEVARTGTWTLVQVAAEAHVTRAMARAAVERGLLPKAGYTETDVVLARVAAACLGFADPTALPARGKPDSSRRDATALRFTRAALTDPATTFDTVLILAGSDVDIANSRDEAASALIRMMPVPVLVLPIGRWRAMLPSIQRRTPAHPASTLRLVKRSPAFPTTATPVSEPTSPTTGYAAFTDAKHALTEQVAEQHAALEEDPFALPDPF